MNNLSKHEHFLNGFTDTYNPNYETPTVPLLPQVLRQCNRPKCAAGIGWHLRRGRALEYQPLHGAEGLTVKVRNKAQPNYSGAPDCWSQAVISSQIGQISVPVLGGRGGGICVCTFSSLCGPECAGTCIPQSHGS